MLLEKSDKKYVSASALTAMPHVVLGKSARTDTIAMDWRTVTENTIYWFILFRFLLSRAHTHGNPLRVSLQCSHTVPLLSLTQERGEIGTVLFFFLLQILFETCWKSPFFKPDKVYQIHHLQLAGHFLTKHYFSWKHQLMKTKMLCSSCKGSKVPDAEGWHPQMYSAGLMTCPGCRAPDCNRAIWKPCQTNSYIKA